VQLARDTHVYVIHLKTTGQIIYTGISNNPAARELQHMGGDIGKTFGPRNIELVKVTVQALTRLQARAVEQAIIDVGRIDLLNKINSISPSNPLSGTAQGWAMNYIHALYTGMQGIAGNL
jgi:predicted GIY-YIG superfamily endonuclease